MMRCSWFWLVFGLSLWIAGMPWIEWDRIQDYNAATYRVWSKMRIAKTETNAEN